MTPARQAPHPDRRAAFVDYAKGFCILMVVSMHSTLSVGEALERAGFMHAVVAFAKPFRMPDFFLISGLFLWRAIDRPWRGYLDVKVAHFAYFYALWVAIQFAFKGPGAVMEGDWATLRQFALALVEPFGVLWFIYLLPIFFVLAKRLRGVHPAIVWVTAAALESAGVHTGWTAVDEFAARWVYFVTGWIAAPAAFWLARVAAERPAATLAGLIAWAVVNGAAVFAPSIWPGAPAIAEQPGVRLALGLAGAGAVVAASGLLASRGMLAGLQSLGARSLVIYLAFFLPMAASRAALVRLFPDGDAGWMALAVTACGVVVPLLLARAVAGTPLRFLFERPSWARLAPPRPAAVPAHP